MHSTMSMLALALPLIATASPLPRPDHVLYLSYPVDGKTTQLTANLVKVGDNYNIVAQRPSAYPGTPYYRNGVNPHNNIIFEFEKTGQIAGLVAPTAPNSGDATINTVYAEPGKVGDGLWIVDDKTKAVTHQVRASVADDRFYLCKETINGEVVDVLKVNYPVYGATLPGGCVVTTLTEGDIPFPGY